MTSTLAQQAKNLQEQEARNRADWLDAMRRAYADDRELVPPKKATKAERIAAIQPLDRDERLPLRPVKSPLQAGRAIVDRLIDRGVFFAQSRTVLHRPNGGNLAYILPNADALAEALHDECGLDCTGEVASRLMERVITRGNKQHSENVRAMQAQARDGEV